MATFVQPSALIVAKGKHTTKVSASMSARESEIPS